MAMISPSLSARIARRHGIVTHDELTRDGYTRHALRWQLSNDVLVPVHRGVYRMATSPDTFEARCVAACLADPLAIVTGVAAARLWGFRHVWRPDVPHVLIGHDRTPITRGVVLRRSNVIDASDSVVRDDGIVVASPPRAWFDCARDVSDEHFERLTEWVIDHHAGLLTLWRTTRRLRAKGRPGLGRVNRVMSRRADWQKPAGSGIELPRPSARSNSAGSSSSASSRWSCPTASRSTPTAPIRRSAGHWKSTTSAGTAVGRKRSRTRHAIGLPVASTGKSIVSPIRNWTTTSRQPSTNWC